MPAPEPTAALATIPAMMNAVRVDALSDDFSGTAIARVSVPCPASDEVLVRVHAVAVNFPDILMTRGAYQLKPPLPFVPGSECAGEVVAVGSDVDAAWLGRAVIAGGRYGMMADYVCVPAATLTAKPDAMDWAVAASYRAVYLTAYVALVRRAAVQPGETLLVHGSSGGTGLACVDLGQHLGARVIAAGSSPEKLEQVRHLHAPAAVVDIRSGFRDPVRDLTGGRGADVIFDPVGGDVFDESTRCIAFDGRLLVIGFTSGRIAQVATNIPLIKGFSVVGVRAGEYGRQFPDRGAENLAAVDALAAAGAIRPHVHARLPLADWHEGMQMLLDRKVVGKLALVP